LSCSVNLDLVSVIWDSTIVVSNATHILEALADGDPTATGELLSPVYQELRKLAAYKMAGQALVHPSPSPTISSRGAVAPGG
jgi:hypothetical protein